MRNRLIIAAALAGLLSIFAAAASNGSAAPAAKKTVTVSVADDYFAPLAVKVKVGDRVRYLWSASNTDSHNVHLKKGPSGVNRRKFRSAAGQTGIDFAPRFKVAGKYHFVCTLHTEMQMDVVVRKH
jgi:plastocyanin